MKISKKTKTTGIMPILLMVIIFISSCGNAYKAEDEAPSLKDAFKDAFLIGTALNESQIFGRDSNAVRLTKKHFNAITPENITKWEVIQPEPGVYNFRQADEFVKLGEENDMFMIGHTLVWHSQTPRWVYQDENGDLLSREALLERMRDHIHTVVGRYKGRIQAWDVVNEALNEDGTLRESLWYRIIGEDYLVKAFKYAREADSDAELYYNDYSLENPEKLAGAVRLVQFLQENNAPITGIGTQGHWSVRHPSLEELENTLTDLGALGIDVMITEMEIDVLPAAFHYHGADIAMQAELRDELNPYPDELPEEEQQQLAERYREFFEVMLRHRDNITRVTFWGVADGDSWLNNWPVRGRTSYPLLFDRQWEPKPAFHAVVELAEEVLEN